MGILAVYGVTDRWNRVLSSDRGRTAVSHADHFRHDREGDFEWRLAAKVQTDRGAKARHGRRVDAGFARRVRPGRQAPARANIRRVAAQGRDKAGIIALGVMPADRHLGPCVQSPSLAKSDAGSCRIGEALDGRWIGGPPSRARWVWKPVWIAS